MDLCRVVQIVTPKKVLLDGLWLGPAKPKRAVVFVHGLGSTLFKKLPLARELVDTRTGVLVFNNRGHDKVAGLSRKSGTSLLAGSAYEKFTDCADDIQGAVNFARRQGAKSIFLVGHSTGCQKSIYWASKKGRGVRGIALLAPIGDRSAEVHLQGKKKLDSLVARARSLVRHGKSRELVGVGSWAHMYSGQRFLSLFAGTGPEELFPYADERRTPRVLRSIRTPILAVLAERDEYADRPAMEMASWFGRHIRKGSVLLVPRATHSFKRAEREVAALIQQFMQRV